MKKFIELVKKYKVYILASFLVIFFFRSCIKSSQVRKTDKVIVGKDYVIDSLNNVIKIQKDTINNFPEILRQEKLNIHMEYDNWISARDRSPQLMLLHGIVKENIKEIK
jgi:hypothetical protein